MSIKTDIRVNIKIVTILTSSVKENLPTRIILELNV